MSAGCQFRTEEADGPDQRQPNQKIVARFDDGTWFMKFAKRVLPDEALRH